MMRLCSDVIRALDGRTLVTAESCTGGGIGAALTSVPGSSAVFKGGIISYTNAVKENVLRVPADMLENHGAVSSQVAQAMAEGVRTLLQADIAVSVTGLAGPSGDDFGNPVGTVYIGYADTYGAKAYAYHFSGDREEIRNAAISAALGIVLCEID